MQGRNTAVISRICWMMKDQLTQDDRFRYERREIRSPKHEGREPKEAGRTSRARPQPMKKFAVGSATTSLSRG